MKKIVIFSIQISILLFLVNCSKKKVCSNLPTQDYYGEFITSEGTMLLDPHIEITEVSGFYAVINGSNISRNKCSVTGTIQNMSLLYQGGPVIIQGEIDKKKGQYIIEGSFKTSQGPQAYPISGNFTIKSH